MSDHTLRVENIRPKLETSLSNRMKMVLANKRHGSSPEMFVFSRVYDHDLEDINYQDFARRLNSVAERLDGKTLYATEEDPTWGHKPVLDAILATPMLVPLAPLPKHPVRAVLVAYMFVYDLPYWKWQNDVCTFDIGGARKWLNEKLGDLFVIVREGELPEKGTP